MPRSLAALLTLAALAITAAGAAARDLTIPVVHRGQTARISARVSGTPPCLASVQYSDGLTQNSGIKHARLGTVSWELRIPNNAALGTAHWSVRCGPIAKTTGRWRVVASTTSGGGGSTGPAPPNVIVTGNGFSQRPDKYGTGSKVNYGIFLKDISTTRDAESVYVLINFVDATGQLVGSQSNTVPLVAAGQTYAYGDQMSLRTQTAVAKLEITVRVGAGAAAITHLLPHFANIRFIPDSQDPAWLSEIDGEIANDTSQRTMSSAQLSIVVLDANGAIVGGGKTNVFYALPAGSRMVFLAQSGFSAIPTPKAVSTVISVLPQYQAG